VTISRRKWHYLLFPVAVAAYGVAIIGFGAAASVEVGKNSWVDATSQVVDFCLAAPLASFFLFLPFFGAEVLTVEVAHRHGLARASGLFVIVVGVLMWMFYDGFVQYFSALAQKKWTASSISLVMIIFWSVPLLLVAAIAAGGLKWKFRKGEA
jgi:hypothetical protein